MTYEIPAVNFSRFSEKITKLNNKASRYGFAPVTATIVNTFTKTYYDNDGQKFTLTTYAVDVTGDAPHVAGWTFVARLTPLENGNLIANLPGEDCPEQFRHTAMVCEHCNINRYRTETYVLRNDAGKYIQVGRNCLGDFLGGQSPEAVARQAGRLIEVREIEDEFRGFIPQFDYVETEEFVATAAAVIRTSGWVARNDADYRPSSASTTLDVLHRSSFGLDYLKNYPEFEVTPDDHEFAAAALAWAINQGGNDYLNNLSLVAKERVIHVRSIGLLASLVNAYGRALQAAYEKKDKPVSAYIGNIGGKVSAKVTVVNVLTFPGYMGGSCDLIVMVDEAGNRIVWKTSSITLERGEQFTITGTVKDQSEYRGEKQTTLTRCKIQEVN